MKIDGLRESPNYPHGTKKFRNDKVSSSGLFVRKQDLVNKCYFGPSFGAHASLYPNFELKYELRKGEEKDANEQLEIITDENPRYKVFETLAIDLSDLSER